MSSPVYAQPQYTHERSIIADRTLLRLSATLLLIFTWGYRLDSYDLLIGGGRGSGFNFVDHQWMLPGLLLLGILTGASAMIVAVSAWMGQVRTSLVAIMVSVAAAAIVQQALPFYFARVTPPAVSRARNEPETPT